MGDGKLGLLVAAVLRLTGAQVVLAGRHPDKLAIAAAWGVRTVLEGDTLPEREIDVVVECTGTPAGFAAARRLLRPRGTLVLKSTYHGELSVDFSALVVDEITVLGSRCGPFAPALRLLAAGLVDPSPLVAGTYDLDDAVEAFEHAGRRGTLKVLLRP